MTTRRWMVAPAVVGLMMGGFILKRRRDEFIARAQRDARREAQCMADEASARDAHAGRSAAIDEWERIPGEESPDAASPKP